MIQALQQGLFSKSGVLRKVSAALLSVPKWRRSWGVTLADFAAAPPVLANSVPKSGTHLLVQIVDGLPNRSNYGAFLASMTSSFQYRRRSPESVTRFIERIVPGEIVRAHLYHNPDHSRALASRNAAHYFVYRDPRDIALSGAHYARSMNRWHKLHRYFRSAKSIDDAITLAIRGLDPPPPGIEFPDIATRFGWYRGWLTDESCFCLRFEDLQSEARPAIVRQMAEFYAARTSTPMDIEACTAAMLQSIAPSKSHTFRSGEKAGWRKAYTLEHRRLFQAIAGDLLIELGYEKDDSWVDSPQAVISSNDL